MTTTKSAAVLLTALLLAPPPWLRAADTVPASSPAAKPSEKKPPLPTSEINGRYVRLEIPERLAVGKDVRGMGRIFEIEIVSGGRNVARHGKVTAAGGASSKIIDGDAKDYASTVSVPPVVNPWLEIDLGREYPIDEIRTSIRGKMVILVSVLGEDRKVGWYRHCYNLRSYQQQFTTIVPRRFDGRYTGRLLPAGCGSWYDILGEQDADRDFILTRLDLGPAPDYSQRQADFRQRDSDAAVEALCRRFHSAVDPDARGMEKYREHFRRGEYRQALDAYREFFFAKLTHPDDYGIPSHFSTFGPVFQPPKMDIDVLAVNEAMNSRRLSIQGDVGLVADVGPAGRTRWIPREPEPGREVSSREIAFFAMPVRSYSPGVAFNDLLNYYCATGEEEYLDRWMDYLDDWCIFGREDFFHSSHNLRMALETETFAIYYNLLKWRTFLQHRPSFAKDLRSTTLARWLLAAVEDCAPYTIRARRAELANFGAYGTGALARLAIQLSEFRAMRYFARETMRLAMSSYIQQRTLDGENIEAEDEPHRHCDDEGLRSVFDFLPFLPLSPAMRLGDDLHRDFRQDLVLPVYRNLLTRVSPSGYDWPRWPGTSSKSPAMDFENERRQLNHIATVQFDGPTGFVQWLKTRKEPEAAARLSAVMDYPASLWLELAGDGGRNCALSQYAAPTLKASAAAAIAAARQQADADGWASLGKPQRFSDLAPYSSMAFLRDSWQAGSEYFQLLSFNERSQGRREWTCAPANAIFGYGAMRYDLMKEGRSLVSSEALIIDKKPPNAWQDGIITGGKTLYCAMAGRHVVDTRFHTSPRFDLAEVRRSDPYSRPERGQYKGDWYNVWTRLPGVDNTPLLGVTAYRQVFHVRGAGVWIVADRIENADGKSHEYSSFWTYPAAVSPTGLTTTIEAMAAAGQEMLVEEAGRIRTAIPGYANISSYMFGPAARIIGRIGPNGEYTENEKTQMQVIKEALAAGVSEKNIFAISDEAPSLRRTGILWAGSGNQSLVTLHYTRPPVADIASQFENELREIQELKGAGGSTGFRATTVDGSLITFQSGPQSVNALDAEPAQVRGESVLAVEQDGLLSGMALGTDSTIILRGKKYQAGVADFEYGLDAEGRFTSTPIHRAIDTVRISPEPNVFTDAAEISFSIPTQDTTDIEFRYTLDGNDPTLDSQLYASPFTITEDTHIKVRPFRRGLKTTPWNIPGEQAGKTVGAIFRKEQPRHALEDAAVKPGLDYEYFEAPWPTLFAHAAVPGVLAPRSRGRATSLLDPQHVAGLRTTDKAYAIRYHGGMQVPATGVYSFRAPAHLYTPTMDAGYDLRVAVDGEEWFPSPTLHSENVWHIALEAGLHRLDVTYVDYRWKKFKNEYWMAWQEGEMWQGTPVLEVSGPGIGKQPLPSAWLKHD
jgi:hypothetical protein